MTIQTASVSDQSAINRVITDAVMAWPMTERAKRLIIPVLCYNADDLTFFQTIVWRDNHEIVAVAAWDTTSRLILNKGRANLLHGLFVTPTAQGSGIGQILMAEVAKRLAQADPLLDGLLIKAERVSVGFFEHCGLERIPAQVAEDYPYQFWKPLQSVPTR